MKSKINHKETTMEKKVVWVCYYINGKGNEQQKVFDNMDKGLAFTRLLDERIEKGTCGGYSFMKRAN